MDNEFNEFLTMPEPFKASDSPKDDEEDIIIEEIPEDNRGIDIDDPDEKAGKSSSSAKKKKSSGNTFQKRIDNLSSRIGEQEQRNMYLQNQLAEKENQLRLRERKFEELAEQKNQDALIANKNYEINLTTQESSIKDQMKNAEESGDTDKKIQLIDQLAELKAKRQVHENWKFQNQQQVQMQERQRAEDNADVYQQSYEQPAPVNQDFQEWISQNPWYGKNPKLTQEANEISDRLQAYMELQGNGHLVGTDGFRNTVANEVKKRYGIEGTSTSSQEEDDEDEGDSYETSAPNYSHVAPVQRRSSMADQYNRPSNPTQKGDPKKISLTREEMLLARHLNRGATENEVNLYKRYQKGKNYPRSPFATEANPYKLTIL